MKKLFFIMMAAALFGIALSGCGTSVALKVVKPAEIPMQNARDLAILDVVVYDQSNPYYAGGNFLSSAINFYYGKQTNYAGSSKRYWYSQQAHSMIVDAMMNTDYFRVYTPQDLFKSSSIYNYVNQSYTQLATGTDIKAYLVPQISNLTVEEWKENAVEYDKYKNPIYFIKYFRSMRVDFSYRVVTVDGKVLAVKNFSDSRSTNAKNPAYLTSEEDLFVPMMEGFVREMAVQLAPRVETVWYSLAEDKTKNPQMKEADKLVVDELYTEAMQLYLQIFEETKNPAAAINASIMYRVMGDLEGGVAYLDKAYGITHDKNILSARKNMEYDIIERDKALKQLGPEGQ
jgi:tetratricopeptide (TPR) repeat protein